MQLPQRAKGNCQEPLIICLTITGATLYDIQRLDLSHKMPMVAVPVIVAKHPAIVNEPFRISLSALIRPRR